MSPSRLQLREIVLKGICEKPVRVCAQNADLIKVDPHENGSKIHSHLTAKDILHVFSGLPFYIINTDSDNVNSTLPKHQRADELAGAPREWFIIKTIDSRCSLVQERLKLTPL